MEPTSEILGGIVSDARPRKRESRYTMRSVLAHDPPVVFEHAAREFVDAVRENTDGDVEVELYGTKEFVAGRGGEDVSRTELVRCLAQGEIEMAHTYVTALGNFHDILWAMELPFLFRDYEHADAVLEGPIARRFMHEMIPVRARLAGEAKRSCESAHRRRRAATCGTATLLSGLCRCTGGGPEVA